MNPVLISRSLVLNTVLGSFLLAAGLYLLDKSVDAAAALDHGLSGVVQSEEDSE